MLIRCWFSGPWWHATSSNGWNWPALHNSGKKVDVLIVQGRNWAVCNSWGTILAISQKKKHLATMYIPTQHGSTWAPAGHAFHSWLFNTNSTLLAANQAAPSVMHLAQFRLTNKQIRLYVHHTLHMLVTRCKWQQQLIWFFEQWLEQGACLQKIAYS